MKLYVLLSDVVGSSSLPDRADLTARLQKASERVNDEHRNDLFANLEITRGDEMAAVLRSASNVYDVLMVLEEELYPVRFRSVLVYDDLTAGLETRRSSVIDGPAFYKAQDKMSALKRTRNTFSLASGQAEFDEAAEVLVNLLQWRWNEMTELQRQIVRNYQDVRNQQKVAEMLGRSQQQISHTLIATKWELINSSEGAIRHMLQLIDRRNATIPARTQHAAGMA
ncbi:MAG: SatD family protein [Acidobacteriota bacterium]|nr:SatD family protein [Acidobacteriota bacterium]